MAHQGIINKTMERSDLESEAAVKIIGELNDLIGELKAQRLKISSWYGRFDLAEGADPLEKINRGYDYQPLKEAADDRNFPWFLYWEILWIILHGEFEARQKVLDLGGSSSLFSYLLASRGLEVTTVDLQEDLVENANLVARARGWNLKNYVMDMRRLNFDSSFDHITSVCVYEHIPMYDRVRINGRIRDLLRPGGRFSITFDYRNPSRFAAINTPQDVHNQFILPSGLKVRGNPVFMDTGDSYLLNPFYYRGIPLRYKAAHIRQGHFRPWEIIRSKSANDYTFGALFQEKE